MNLLWITWKDRFHPDAGGAEIVCREITDRLVADGHQATLLTAAYPDAADEDNVNGAKTIRVGHNRYIHPLLASMYYLRKLRGKFDVVIEEVNAAPYFSVLFERKAQKFLFYHQLERKNWYYETPPPLNHVGHWVLEPVATRILSFSHTPVITVSESTRQDLARHGFPPERTHIISEGIEIDHAGSIETIKKFDRPTVLSLESMRTMKRTLHQVKAFEIAKQAIPELQMKLAGSSNGSYGQKVLDYIKRSKFSDDIEYCGKVGSEEKIALMQQCHIKLSTSVKEGWGLTITEAASQGTPAVVYNIDGLRDSVRSGETGIVVDESPEALAKGIVTILSNNQEYQRLRQNAYEWSRQITFDQSYRDFLNIITPAEEVQRESKAVNATTS